MSTRDLPIPDNGLKRDVLLVGGIVLATVFLYFFFGLLAGVRFNAVVSEVESVIFFTAVFALLALALNLHWGYTGLFNIGVAGFMAIGMYTMAIITASPDGSPAGLGLPIWLGVIGGVAAASIAGAIIALPALRVRADYFAIITLGFAEIVRLSIQSDTLAEIEIGDRVYGTGGGSGISYAAPSNVVEWLFGLVGGVETRDNIAAALAVSETMVDRLVYALIVFLFVAIIYVVLRRIARSPFGRLLKAIREDEVVARSLGKNTKLAKIKVFTLGCGLMGLGGILWYGGRASSINPDSFMPIITFYIFVALIIGGAGSNLGSLIGGFVFAAFLWQGPRYFGVLMPDLDAPSTFYDAFLELGSLDVLPLVVYIADSMNELRWILVGLALIVLMIYRPDGLFGHRKETAAAIDLSSRSDRGDET